MEWNGTGAGKREEEERKEGRKEEIIRVGILLGIGGASRRAVDIERKWD